MRRRWCRLRATLRRWVSGGTSDLELGEELRAYVEQDIESKIRSGMSAADARRAALIELGGAEQVKAQVREVRAGIRWDGIVQDIRYAVRSLGHARGFSCSVIANLSLGLAALFVAFAFINGALLRPFPGVRGQDRLVTLGIQEVTPIGPRLPLLAPADYPDLFRALGEGMTSLDGLAGYTESVVAVSFSSTRLGARQPRSLVAGFVSPNYFDVLGLQPAIGRTLPLEENAAAAIIGHALWTGEFGRDPSVVGRSIHVGRQVFQIVGVAPPGFAGTSQNPVEAGVEVWLPIALVDAVSDPRSSGRNNIVFLDDEPGTRLIRYVGRMRDDVDVNRVEAQLGLMARPIAAAASVPVERLRVEVSGLTRLDATDAVTGAELAGTILAVPCLVLVIACVNAANLLLVRASRRRRELAVRLALGASRLRVVRQLVIESLVLAVSAAVLALPLAWSGLRAGAMFMTIPTPLDGTVVAVALGAAFMTALGFGLVPALRAAGQLPSGALGTSPASGSSPSESRGRWALVAVQVALSLGLLASAFQLTSALESLAEPPGTDPDRLLLASFDLGQLRYAPAERDAFYAALVDGASRLPGVAAAGLSSRNLAGNWTFDAANLVRLDTGGGNPVGGISASASGDYFGALRLDMVQGRDFVAADRRDIPEVAIVTTRLASRLFDGAALGRRVRVSTGFRGAVAADVYVVGVVESPVGLSGEEVSAIFFPSPFPSPIQGGAAQTLHVRTDGPAELLAPAIRDLVARIDPQAPILGLATLGQEIRRDYLFERALARAAALLGIVALLLASVGLYGVASYSVALRAREIAIRMALGARAGLVVAMILRRTIAVATIGTVLGGLAAIGAGLVIQSEVFGVAGVDAAVLGGSAALLAAAMLVASILPAWRAARLDPNAVLRTE